MNSEVRYASITASVCFVLFVILLANNGIVDSILIIPILILLPLVVYFQFKPKEFFCSPESMLNEAPVVIGIFSTVLSSGGSFDHAVRTIAKTGPKNISRLFTKIVNDADCRINPDIRSAIKDELSEAPKELSSFRRAMLIVISAFDSDSVVRQTSMIKDAEDIVLSGLKEMGESYSAKLNMPCMIVFGIGIMIPMILISILPMLGVGGQFSSPLDTRALTAIILVIVPVFVLGIIMSMKGKNPFFSVSKDYKDYLPLLALASGIPIFFVVGKDMDLDKAFLFTMIATAIVSIVVIVKPVIYERNRVKTESVLQDVLFELSNRLTMGENYDVALERSLESRKDCNELYLRMKRELALCRGDVSSAVSNVISPISETMGAFYNDIYLASLKDTRNSGKLALSIAHQIQDQNSVRNGIELKLKNMLDMMTGTAALFAPLILGMSIVMLGPISKISDVSVMGDVKPILLVYLVELSALISILSSNLMCRGNIIDIQWRFSLMMPVSLIVFTLCCGISI